MDIGKVLQRKAIPTVFHSTFSNEIASLLCDFPIHIGHIGSLLNSADKDMTCQAYFRQKEGRVIKHNRLKAGGMESRDV